MTRREAMALLAAGALGAKSGGSKETLPRIGLGTWQTFDVGSSDAARKPLRDVLAEFVKYGRSEDVLGDLAVEVGVRDKLFVATKVWTSGRTAGIRQMEDSERKLRGRVDLMQVHNLVDVETHLATLREWKREGRIRYLGITHYTAGAYGDLERVIDRGGIDFVQLNYSIAEREAERRILPHAAAKGVRVLINRPFGGGSLFREVRSKPLPAFAAEIGCASWAELFLKFVVSHPAVTCAIPATSKVEHLRQNMRAGGGVLPDAAMRKRIGESV